MNTKEINVFIDMSDMGKSQKLVFDANLVAKGFDTSNLLMAKLIVQIPERKIEITEDQLEKAFWKFAVEWGLNAPRNFSEKGLDIIKRELGFK